MSMRVLNILMVMSISIVVAACGGGGGGNPSTDSGATAPTRVDSAFASPAIFVPTGQSAKSFNLAGCVRDSDSGRVQVTSATLALQANGDMVFSGAIGTATAAVAEIARLNFAELTEAEISVSTGVTKVVNIEARVGDREMDLNAYGTDNFFYFDGTSSVNYDCEISLGTETFFIEQPLSAARIASNIVTGSTGDVTVSTSMSTSSYTVTGSIVSWDTGRTGTFARFASFNLDTAQLGQGSTLNASSHTPVSFSVPQQCSAIRCTYEERAYSDGLKIASFTYDNFSLGYRILGTSSTPPKQRRFTPIQRPL